MQGATSQFHPAIHTNWGLSRLATGSDLAIQLRATLRTNLPAPPSANRQTWAGIGGRARALSRQPDRRRAPNIGTVGKLAFPSLPRSFASLKCFKALEHIPPHRSGHAFALRVVSVNLHGGVQERARAVLTLDCEGTCPQFGVAG